MAWPKSKAIALCVKHARRSNTIEKRFMVNDTTTEKMVVIHKDNPNGILVYREELMGLFCSLNKKGREEDRAFYLQSWNGSNPLKLIE